MRNHFFFLSTPKLVIGDITVDCLFSYKQTGKVMVEEFKTSITASHRSGKKHFDPIGKSQ